MNQWLVSRASLEKAAEKSPIWILAGRYWIMLHVCRKRYIAGHIV